jgi:hypothetical protein
MHVAAKKERHEKRELVLDIFRSNLNVLKRPELCSKRKSISMAQQKSLMLAFSASSISSIVKE